MLKNDVNNSSDYTKYVVNYKKRGNDDNETFYKPITTLNLITTPLPPTFSLQNKIPFIFDQGLMGSCVSNAISLNIAYLNNNFIPSRLFIYYNGRTFPGYVINEDTGLAIYDGCNSVKQFLPCQEK